MSTIILLIPACLRQAGYNQENHDSNKRAKH